LALKTRFSAASPDKMKLPIMEKKIKGDIIVKDNTLAAKYEKVLKFQ